MLNKVKLANGTEVDWEEFSRWSTYKQNFNLISRKLSDETRKKIGKANKGKIRTEEMRAHSRTIPREKHKEETRKKIGLAHKGKVVSKETRQKLSKTGKARDVELYKKIGAKLKGRTPWNKGFKFLEFREIQTPNGTFKHINAVAYYAKRDVTTIRNWMTKWPDHYYFIKI